MLARPRTRTPRLLTLFALLTSVVVAAQAVALPRGAAAQGSGAAIEGSWTVGFPNDDPTSRQLLSFLPGGVALATNAPVFEEHSVEGDLVYSTAGHGAWSSLGEGRYAFTIVFLYFDAAEENWGTLTLDGLVTLDASGDRFTGTYDVTVTSAAGMSLFEAEEEPLTGARIRVRPPV